MAASSRRTPEKPCVPERQLPSLVPECGEDLAVGHQLRALAGADALESESVVIGARAQLIIALDILIAGSPDAHALHAHGGGFVIVGQRNLDAAAVAIDAAAEPQFVRVRLG